MSQFLLNFYFSIVLSTCVIKKQKHLMFGKSLMNYLQKQINFFLIKYFDNENLYDLFQSVGVFSKTLCLLTHLEIIIL